MQARILDAAIREFSDHGYSGGRIDRISRRAKTVDRMLYYYFGNKERLFRTVLEHAYAQMVRAQQALAVDAADPVAGMRQLVAHSWGFYVEHPEIVRLLTTENLHNGRHIRTSTRIRRISLPLIDATRVLLASGQAKGLFRTDVEARDVLLTVMALGFFYVANRHTLSQWNGIDLMGAERRARWLEHITAVVLDFLARRPASRQGRAAASSGDGARQRLGSLQQAAKLQARLP